MRYVTWETVRATGDRDTVDAATSALMDALIDLENSDNHLSDADLTVNLASGVVEVQMVIEAEDLGDAANYAHCVLRTAIHATGGHTPGWETQDAMLRVGPETTSDEFLADA